MKIRSSIFITVLFALAGIQSFGQSNKMTIEPLVEENQFPKAKLTIKDMKTEMLGIDSVKLSINFAVSNYELTQQTMDMMSGECANSINGQHIHFILDNKPYQALYKPENKVNLPINSEHYLLVFLSRSYHLSVKSPQASVLLHFKIDAKGNLIKLVNTTNPMLFYSRPKGEYVGKDTENLLLDFYVKNAKISPYDFKVQISVADTTFVVDKWQPYFIKNAPLGELKLNIQLLDKKGNMMRGNYTAISRTVILK